MWPSAKALNDSIIAVPIPPLEPGVIYPLDVAGRTLFVLKPSQEQTAAIRALDLHVWDVSAPGYLPEEGMYAYWGYSPRWGCPLEHHPPQESMLLGWEANAKWLGGYWDNRCEVSYDYAGRAIRTYGFTYNGYS